MTRKQPKSQRSVERDGAAKPQAAPAVRLLDRIDGPEDLKDLSEAELAQLADEVRAHIIDTVGEIGGHFGANLGTCELAVALHSLLQSPRDKILWDVGHQAYPHKILTGRRDRLSTIRQYGGLAPFCAIAESEHDIMGAGHASTSVGYAVGIKEAMRLRAWQLGEVAVGAADGEDADAPPSEHGDEDERGGRDARAGEHDHQRDASAGRSRAGRAGTRTTTRTRQGRLERASPPRARSSP